MPPNSKETVLSDDMTDQKSTDISVISVSSETNTIWTFDETLKEIGFGKVQWQLMLVIVLILMTVLNETMGISFLIPAAQCDLDLSTTDKGLLSSMTFIGIMVSSYFWGFLGDTQGRRLIILICLLMSTIFTLTSVFIENFTLFVACRFMTGFFVSGYSATVYAYIGEFVSDKNRATIISWISCAIGIAMFYQPLMAWWILRYDWRFEMYEGFLLRPWRIVMITYAIPGILGGLWLLRFPESPKFLLTQNQNEKALEIMHWMYRTNKGNKNHDDFPVSKLKSEESTMVGTNYKGAKAIFASLVHQTLPLFKPPYALYFFACSFLHFGTFSIAGGMALFLPDTLNRLSKAPADMKVCDVLQMSELKTSKNSTLSELICDDSVAMSIFVDAIYVAIGFLIGFIVLSLSIKPLGRRKIFVGSLLASGASGIILMFVTSHIFIILLFGIFILFCGLNVSVINGAVVDLIPTHLRAMAVCVSMMFGRLGSALSSNLIGYFIEDNCEITYFTFSGLALVCLAVSFILPDSKKVKSSKT